MSRFVIGAVNLAAVLFFILALKGLSRPSTARRAILWAGGAMLAAVIAAFAVPGLGHRGLIAAAVLLGGSIAWVFALKVPMTGMPQMIAIYNGMGGGAAGAIAAIELLGRGGSAVSGQLSVLGGLIGAASFSGSLIAFLKLQGWMRQKPFVFLGQRALNALILAAAVALGVFLPGRGAPQLVSGFFALGLLFGLMMTLPIGGGDMPVVISLYNALTGLAVSIEGFAIGNIAMGIAGMLVGAAGTLLTLLMAKAMNRSLWQVLFSAFGAEETAAQAAGDLKPIGSEDAAVMLAYSASVVVVPGYGMAVAQAQHKVKELMDGLESRGVRVKFAIHPVAGRMPGHMNVLLAEADVPYDRLFDRDEINAEFASTDVALVIGANDVVNPAANRPGNPLSGMPILDAEKAKNVIILKRGKGAGFSGVENELFLRDNARMLYGSAAETVSKLIQELKQL